MNRVAVFLASRQDVSENYREAAERFGAWLGSTGRTLVYGGIEHGLMELLAAAVKRHGGRVVGLVPECMRGHRRVSGHVDVEFRCPDMADRKRTAVEESDVIVALPGGIGTLDEVMSALTSAIVGEHRKRIILYNVDHCWDSLLAMLADMERRGLATMPPSDILAVTDDFEELTKLVQSA